MCLNIPAEFVILTSVCILTAGNILTSTEAFGAFGSSKIIMFALCYCIAAIIKKTELLNSLFNKIMGNGNNIFFALFKISIICLILSPFLFNTAIVAIFMPLLEDYADKMNMNKKSILMTLSVMSIAGGGCFDLGSSTNIVSKAAANEYYLKYDKNN